MYYQRLHGKPSFGGYLSRAAETSFSIGGPGEEPGLGYLSCSGCPGPRPQDMNPDEARQVFRQYKIKYVVQKNGGYLGFAEHSAYLAEVVGLRPIFTDPTLIVYRNQEIE